MTRALSQNLDMPSDGVLVSLVHKFIAETVPKVRLPHILHRTRPSVPRSHPSMASQRELAPAACA